MAQAIMVDVTQLVHWPGRLAGITRVMNELAVRFAAEPNVRFVSWVKERGSLCEIDLAKSLARRGQGVVYSHGSNGANAVPAVTAMPSLTWKAQREATRLVKAGLRRVLRVSPILTSKVEMRLRRQHFAGLVDAEFRAGDVLFIPWGEWWDEGFTQYVVGREQQGVRVVQIIHDIAPTAQPQFFEQVAVSPTTYNAAVLPGAALVLTVSRNTKRELTEWLRGQGLTLPRIEVIRNGDNVPAAKTERPTDAAFTGAKLKGGDYLLTVGTLEAKKNHALLYYVYKLAKRRGIEVPKIVIVGRHGFRTGDIYEVMTHDPEVKDRFIFLHNASDEELAWLYDHCLFTVLPSFHEGWGIPIAESLARGVPCLCSDTSSMTEIAEGIVEHFSPFSTDECLDAIERWLDPKVLSKARIATQRYRPTSWDETFNQVTGYMKEMK